MRIFEILLWDGETPEEDLSNPQPDLPRAPFSDDLVNLANAFTRRGLVKHFWNLKGSEAQPPSRLRKKSTERNFGGLVVNRTSVTH